MQTEESIRLWEAISTIQRTITSLSAAVQETASNKSTNIVADSASDTKYPTVKAVKTFVNSVARNADGRLAEEINRAKTIEAMKENIVNKSSNVALGTSDVLFPTQNAVKTYVDSSTGVSSSGIVAEVTRATAAEATLTTNLANEVTRATATEATLTTNLALKEILANKSTSIDVDATSDVKYPSVKAVKTYVDTVNKEVDLIAAEALIRAAADVNVQAILNTNITAEATTRANADTELATNLTAEVTRATATEALKENLANKSIDVTTDGASDDKYPSVKAVKTYVDTSADALSTSLTAEVTRATSAESTLTANLTAEVTRATAAEASLTTSLTTEVNRATAAEALKENSANKSTITTLGTSDTLFPTQNAVKTYVDNVAANVVVADASTTVKGKIQLAGDLGGTAEAPTVPGLALKENTANKSTTTTLGTSDILFPTQNAVKTYVDAETSRATAIEALKEILANKSTSITTDGASDDKYPSAKAVKTYVDTSSADVSSALSAEVARATAAEATLTTGLTAEVARATTAEATLTTGLTAEVTRATAAESTLTTNLTAEVTRATAAEATLTTDLTAEVTRATAAESTLTTDLTAEVTRATAAEATLTTDLTAEVTRATAAEATLTTDLTAEVTRATAAEALKENTANKSTSIALGTSDVLFPTQNAVKSYVDAVSGASTTALASEATARATADTTLTTDLTAEVTRATAAEATLTTDLTAEVTRATAAEATLTTNLAAEVTRATAAEALKEDAANKSINTALGTSDVLFPTQNAVKTYVDTAIAAIPSDYRIKTDVQTLDSAYTIDNIRPVTYRNTLKNKQEIGVIAHELQAIYPCLVNGEKDGETLQTVNYNGLFGILINEIQMLKQKINEMSV